MTERIWKRAEELSGEAIALRRDLHRYPENGFCEYRTAAMIVTKLRALGFKVFFGGDANDPSYAKGLPAREEQSREMRRAEEEGADPWIVSEMADGMTGVIGVIEGEKAGDGKTVAFRFDIDANDASEAMDDGHRPVCEGFASLHPNAMHACGHDGHVAIGLTLAKLLSEHRDAFSGRVKLIFQPAEEGVRGAEVMLMAGAVDDVDVLLSGHIGIGARENRTVVASVGGFLAATKYSAVFRGRSSHAGIAPEEGRNALLAAAQATLALHAIPRHGKGASRINVGVLSAGTGRNVVPDRAVMDFEIRGESDEIHDFMRDETERIVRATAEMYGVTVELKTVGYASDFVPDESFGKEIFGFVSSLGKYDRVIPYEDMNASEDCTAFLRRVTERGGKAAYMMYGAALSAGHHNDRFDFDEDVLWRSAALLATLALRYTEQ